MVVSSSEVRKCAARVARSIESALKANLTREASYGLKATSTVPRDMGGGESLALMSWWAETESSRRAAWEGLRQRRLSNQNRAPIEGTARRYLGSESHITLWRQTAPWETVMPRRGTRGHKAERVAVCGRVGKTKFRKADGRGDSRDNKVARPPLIDSAGVLRQKSHRSACACGM